jgi:hypothetical protein
MFHGFFKTMVVQVLFQNLAEIRFPQSEVNKKLRDLMVSNCFLFENFDFMLGALRYYLIYMIEKSDNFSQTHPLFHKCFIFAISHPIIKIYPLSQYSSSHYCKTPVCSFTGANLSLSDSFVLKCGKKELVVCKTGILFITTVNNIFFIKQKMIDIICELVVNKMKYYIKETMKTIDKNYPITQGEVYPNNCLLLFVYDCIINDPHCYVNGYMKIFLRSLFVLDSFLQQSKLSTNAIAFKKNCSDLTFNINLSQYINDDDDDDDDDNNF